MAKTNKNSVNMDTINDIALEVVEERLDQFEKWGPQDHPSFYSPADTVQYGKVADHWKQRNDARVEAGTLAWDGILLEEVYEALAETDLVFRRAELVQVAAVAQAEIESIDRVLIESETIEVDEEDVA